MAGLWRGPLIGPVWEMTEWKLLIWCLPLWRVWGPRVVISGKSAMLTRTGRALLDLCCSGDSDGKSEHTLTNGAAWGGLSAACYSSSPEGRAPSQRPCTWVLVSLFIALLSFCSSGQRWATCRVLRAMSISVKSASSSVSLQSFTEIAVVHMTKASITITIVCS